MNVLLFLVGTLVLLVVLILVYAAVVYNKLVRLRERFRNGYAQIDVQLKRRHDLIPNLVETVKGYMTHERETLETVIAARNAAVSASSAAAARPNDEAAVRQVGAAEGGLLAALGQFMAVREAYPDLKADQQANRLMEELATTENRVAFARQHYNDSVMSYNAYRQSFPPALIAGSAGFGEAALFEINDPREREAATVKFDKSAPSADDLA